MEMQVLNAAACREPEIVSDIVAGGTIDAIEDIKTQIDRPINSPFFGFVQFPDIGDVPFRKYDEMAWVVGI